MALEGVKGVIEGSETGDRVRKLLKGAIE